MNIGLAQASDAIPDVFDALRYAKIGGEYQAERLLRKLSGDDMVYLRDTLRKFAIAKLCADGEI